MGAVAMVSTRSRWLRKVKQLHVAQSAITLEESGQIGSMSVLVLFLQLLRQVFSTGLTGQFRHVFRLVQ